MTPEATSPQPLLPISPDTLLLCKEKSMGRIKPSLFFGSEKGTERQDTVCPAPSQVSVAVLKQKSLHETTVCCQNRAGPDTHSRIHVTTYAHCAQSNTDIEAETCWLFPAAF